MLSTTAAAADPSPDATSDVVADDDQDDTADIDTESSVDTAEGRRRFVFRGDVRALLNYADLDGRDGTTTEQREDNEPI